MTGRPAHPKEEPTMIPYADDDMGMTVSDWFDCADAFLLGRIGGHLTDARSGASAAAGDPGETPAGGHVQHAARQRPRRGRQPVIPPQALRRGSPLGSVRPQFVVQRLPSRYPVN